MLNIYLEIKKQEQEQEILTVYYNTNILINYFQVHLNNN